MAPHLRIYDGHPAPWGVVLAAGGSGGHLYPAIAIAEALRKAAPDLAVMIVGSVGDAVDVRQQIPAGVAFERLEVARGSRLGRFLTTAASSFLACRQLLARFARRGVAVSLGGHTAVPVALAARSLGWQVAIVEPNVVPGRANRMLLPFADLVCVGTAETLQRLAAKCPTKLTGIPIRSAIVEAAVRRLSRAASRNDASRSTQATTFRPTAIVATLGGSQGARSINSALVRLVQRMAGRSIWFVHQTGKADWERVRRAYRDADRPVVAMPYVEAVEEVYETADLVIMRAGASLIAEVAACGIPAVLIPYPHAIANHQRFNAEHASRCMGWRVLMEERDGGIDAMELERAVLELLSRGRRAVGEWGELHRAAAKTVASELLRRVA